MADAPFSGEYPSRQEIVAALDQFGLADYADTEVTPQMGNRLPGPLADKLTECRSKDLATGWPVFFRTGVRSMLESAGVQVVE